MGKNSGVSFVIDAMPIRSFARGLLRSTVVDSEDVASTVTESGAVMLGSVVSIIVTVCVVVAELPDESVAVHVTIVFPNGNASGLLLIMDSILTMSVTWG